MTHDMTTGPVFPKQPVIEPAALVQRPSDLPSLLDLPNRVLTHSGRSALFLALQLLDVRRGDGVLVPTYHCPTMISPVERIGATPVFYPISHSGLPDLRHLGHAETHGIRAILVPHLFGLPQQLEELADFCRSRCIALIEDCAHCFFGRTDHIAVGTIGDFAIGSLPKFFPVTEGGLLTSATRDIPQGLLPARPFVHELRGAWDMVDLAARAGRLGGLGMAARTVASYRRHRLRDRPSDSRLVEDDGVGESLRTASLRDPLLLPARLRRIDSFVLSNYDHARSSAARRLNYRSISAALAGARRAHIPFPDCNDSSAPYVFPLLVPDADAPYARMRTAGLPVYRWDRVWPGTPAFPQDAASSWSRGLIQIACHQSLRSSEIGEMCGLIRRCLEFD